MNMKKVLGMVIITSMVVAVFVPGLEAKSQPPPVEEEKGGIVEEALKGLLVFPPEMRESGFPYDQLYACLNFTVPPCAPVGDALPVFLVRLLNIVNSILETDPEVISKVAFLALPMLCSDPYGIIALLELLMNPFSLTICNPLTWPSDPNCQALWGGIQPVNVCLDPLGFVQTMLNRGAVICSSWLIGIGGPLNLIPSILGTAEREFK
jgi:hypothetical protein